MWWDLVGKGGTHLAPLAKSMLAKVCHFCCTKEIGVVRNQSRNLLSLARAKNLVYNLSIWFE